MYRCEIGDVGLLFDKIYPIRRKTSLLLDIGNVGCSGEFLLPAPGPIPTPRPAPEPAPGLDA
eukprot:8029196-Pyramimonas_sp.AAC.1